MRTAVHALPVALIAVFLPFAAHAATIYLDPATATYGPGDTFITSVRIDTNGQCVNAAHVEIAYPPDELRVIDFSRGNSIFSIWVENPQINDATGHITFSGGVPAGYCGRIPGDSAQSNTLGEIIFTVLKTGAKSAAVQVLPTSSVYLNNGLGTKASLTLRNAAYTLQATPTQTTNPWVEQLKTDTTPPEPFTVQVESTKGVFNGAYYAVFSTVDKQSGIDHYEIFENGVWKRVTSPYVLADQQLSSPIRVRAIDKAGNIRIGTYNASTTPPRVGSSNSVAIIVLFVALGLLLVLRWLWERRVSARAEQPNP